MRAYFTPNGLGLGHVSRCIPLAETLRETGDEILFSSYCDGLTYLQKTDFNHLAAPPIAHKVQKDGTIDFRLTTARPGPFGSVLITLNQLGFELRTMRAFKPDVVVSDSRATPIVAAKMLDVPIITILNQFQVVIPRRRRFLRLAKLADAGVLTIVGKIWSLSDKILMPDFPPPFTISWNQKIPPRYSGKIRLIGPILTTYPSQLPSKEELRRELGFDDRPLIFAPISGPIMEKAYFEGILQRALKKFPRDYQILMTLGNPRFKKNVVKQGDFSVYHWVNNRFEFLKACDLVICRGGHGSITQAIAYGKPMIIVPTPNHSEQAANSKRAEALGIARIVDQKELDSSTLLKATEEILGRSHYRERASVITAQLKDSNAVAEVVEEARRIARANR